MTLKQALWEIVRDENIIITNQNIDWLLDRAEKRANDNTDKNKLKGSILERKEKLDKLGESENKSNEELFKKALLEGINRRIDKTIEEEKRIEQIEKMARAWCGLPHRHDCEGCYCRREGCCYEINISEMLYNAGYRKQSEWISVEDRLPEEGGEYLVFGRTFGNKKPQIWICERISVGSVIGWCNNAKNPIVEAWMPLPEAPKMKGGVEE